MSQRWDHFGMPTGGPGAGDYNDFAPWPEYVEDNVREQKSGFVVETDEEYHASTTWWSKSMLWDFRDRRSVCHQRYVLGTAPDKRSTKTMDIGTLAHAAFLEPDRLDSLYAVYPDSILAKNGAISTNEAKAFRDENEAAGRICLKDKEFLVIRAMLDSVTATIGEWLTEDAIREQSIYWVDNTFETDVPCRCRPDLLIARSEFSLAVDIKSTADITPAVFRKRFEDMGYWLQDQHYSEGIEVVTGNRPRFLFVVVESEWPFDCAVYELREEDRGTAWAKRRLLVEQVSRCLVSGDWSDDWSSGINILSLRKWAMEA